MDWLLQSQHPDVMKITQKWGRWQHHVDYNPFEGNALVLRPEAVILSGIDERGMRITEKGR